MTCNSSAPFDRSAANVRRSNCVASTWQLAVQKVAYRVSTANSGLLAMQWGLCCPVRTSWNLSGFHTSFYVLQLKVSGFNLI